MTDGEGHLPTPPRKRRRSDDQPSRERARSEKPPAIRQIPFDSRDSFLEYLMSNESSIWLKIAGGAIGLPLLLWSFSRKKSMAGELPNDPSTLMTYALWAVAIGAVLGGFLGVKDWVEKRKAKELPVPLIVNVFFGFGVWSLLFA